MKYITIIARLDHMTRLNKKLLTCGHQRPGNLTRPTSGNRPRTRSSSEPAMQFLLRFLRRPRHLPMLHFRTVDQLYQRMLPRSLHSAVTTLWQRAGSGSRQLKYAVIFGLMGCVLSKLPATQRSHTTQVLVLDQCSLLGTENGRIATRAFGRILYCPGCITTCVATSACQI